MIMYEHQLFESCYNKINIASLIIIKNNFFMKYEIVTLRIFHGVFKANKSPINENNTPSRDYTH